MMAKQQQADVYQARVSFSVGGRIIRAGETVRAGHELLRSHPEKFEPFTVDHDLEQATAAPGEKRGAAKK
jgi:hypothetical protein